MSEKYADFIKALADVQAKLNAPKGQYNSFGKYSYRSCEDILSAVKPLLAKHGMVIILTDTVEQIGDRQSIIKTEEQTKEQTGGRYYIKATATITNGVDSISNTAYAREDESKKGMDGSQVTGTASSYARKYALNGLLLIDDTKDADTDEYALKTGKTKAAAPVEKKVLCPNCGKEVKAIRTKNGNTYTAEQVLEQCGGVCKDCYKATKEGA